MKDFAKLRTAEIYEILERKVLSKVLAVGSQIAPYFSRGKNTDAFERADNLKTRSIRVRTLRYRDGSARFASATLKPTNP